MNLYQYANKEGIDLSEARDRYEKVINESPPHHFKQVKDEIWAQINEFLGERKMRMRVIGRPANKRFVYAVPHDEPMGARVSVGIPIRMYPHLMKGTVIDVIVGGEVGKEYYDYTE